jgi:hypothetical protein
MEEEMLDALGKFMAGLSGENTGNLGPYALMALGNALNPNSFAQWGMNQIATQNLARFLAGGGKIAVDGKGTTVRMPHPIGGDVPMGSASANAATPATSTESKTTAAATTTSAQVPSPKTGGNFLAQLLGFLGPS